MDSFLVLPEDVHSNRLTLRGDESKHLARVLRKTVGDRILCTDGNDRMFEAKIDSLGSDVTVCTILATHERYNELAVDITLAVSLLKNPARFDWLVEKTTELGVSAIVPIVCERTIAKKEKHTRLEHIAVAATKQCGRSYVRRISEATTFETMLERSDDFTFRFIAHEKTDSAKTLRHASAALVPSKSVLVMIGPEGGFTDEEVNSATTRNVLPLSLGSRRLRAETAAVAAINLIGASL